MAQQPKSLAELGLRAQGGQEARITGLSVDNRHIAKGMLFAALPGSGHHGANFARQALEAGAAAVLTDAIGANICAEAVADAKAFVRADSTKQTGNATPVATLAFALSLFIDLFVLIRRAHHGHGRVGSCSQVYCCTRRTELTGVQMHADG